MPGDYSILASVYDRIGLSDYAKTITPRLIDYAQKNDWMGRRITDLGCGTGGSASWLCANKFSVTGIDQSAEMLDAVQTNLDEKALSLFRGVQQDILALSPSDGTDMAIALNVLNEFSSLQDIERVFGVVQKALPAGRLFIFDMMTIEGLTQAGLERERLVYDNRELLVFTRSDYDYDRQILTRRYFIFRRAGAMWQRQEASQVQRAYPVQGLGALVQRSGFNVMAVLNPDLKPYESGVSSAPRAIFVTKRR